MYTPKHFEVKDREILLSFMRQYNFALIITATANFPKGTHLPFIMEERGEDIYLVSHLAKANDQWKGFNSHDKSLVIFSEPHAYISTSFYGQGDKVPTWNYTAIHAYGCPVILAGEEEKKSVLEKMITTFHAPDLIDYRQLDEKYLRKMLKGIVAFEMKIDDLQGKFKMSQNREKEEKENIVRAFEKSEDSMVRDVAALIKKVNKLT